MKKRQIICNLIAVIMFCACVLTGCEFLYSTKLASPTLYLRKSENSLFWNANFNATAYEIYRNESKVDVVEVQDNNQTQYVYDYSSVVSDAGTFRFQIKCIGDKNFADSDLSNTVTLTLGSGSEILNKNVGPSTIYEEVYAPTNVTNNNYTISWNAPAGDVDGYTVNIFTNSLGVKSYPCSTNSFSITSNMMSGNEILAIQVCSVAGENLYRSNNNLYINPIDNDKYGTYTDNIYVFDGCVYDYYIENWEELQNFYYYAFINRMEEVKFIVNFDFYDEYKYTYFDTSYLDDDNSSYYIHGKSYFETLSFYEAPHLMGPTSVKNSQDKYFTLKCKFDIQDNVAITNAPTDVSVEYYQENFVFEPYYNMVSYERRLEDFDDFVSDNWLLREDVSSSEQLFWAVSNHVTPIVKSGSMAETIYNNAKDVLREIICDDMTEYEKVLSIFDWIILNGNYDEYSNMQAKQDPVPENYSPMYDMCYYLESLLYSSTNLAVCDGYAKTFALLCNMEGINCVRVMGTTPNGGHAWNKVEIAGNWYLVDITWSDKGSDNIIDATHTYFLVSDEFVEATHFDFENREIFKQIKCDYGYNYYHLNYFEESDVSYDRIITSKEELTIALRHYLKNSYLSMELVFDLEYFLQNDKDITSLLVDAKDSFCGVMYPTYFIKYVCDKGEQLAILYVKPHVSISTNTKFNDYIDFVIENTLECNYGVQLETSYFQGLTGYTSGMTEEEWIQHLQNRFNNAFSAKGENITTKITRTEADKTTTSYSQDDFGIWAERTLTFGTYTIEYVYE